MKMEKPTAEAVRFQNSDVIATSGGVRISGFGDKDSQNNTIQVGNQPPYFTNTSGNYNNIRVPADLINEVNGASGSGADASNILFYCNDTEYQSLESLWNFTDDDDGSDGWLNVFNGAYTWQNGAWYWYKNN